MLRKAILANPALLSHTFPLPLSRFSYSNINTLLVKNAVTLFALLISLAQASAQNDASTAKPADFTDYGGKFSVGISILDGVGVPVRMYRDNYVFELGAYSAGILLNDLNEDPVVVTAPMFGAGYSYFGKKFLKEKKKRNKIKSNGFVLRVNQIVGEYNTTIPSLSWAQEIFRQGRTNRSFLFELGIQYGFPHYTYNGSTPTSSVGLRLRCQWNLFLK